MPPSPLPLRAESRIGSWSHCCREQWQPVNHSTTFTKIYLWFIKTSLFHAVGPVQMPMNRNFFRKGSHSHQSFVREVVPPKVAPFTYNCLKAFFSQFFILLTSIAKMVKSAVTLASGKQMPLVGFGLWKVPKETAADTVYNVRVSTALSRPRMLMIYRLSNPDTDFLTVPTTIRMKKKQEKVFAVPLPTA